MDFLGEEKVQILSKYFSGLSLLEKISDNSNEKDRLGLEDILEYLSLPRDFFENTSKYIPENTDKAKELEELKRVPVVTDNKKTDLSDKEKDSKNLTDSVWKELEYFKFEKNYNSVNPDVRYIVKTAIDNSTNPELEESLEKADKLNDTNKYTLSLFLALARKF